MSGEGSDINIDNLIFITDLQVTESNLIQSYDSNDNEWQQSFVLGGVDLSAITHGSVIIAVDVAPGVDFTSTGFVEVTLDYNAVPEPSTALLLAFGLAALAVGRRQEIAE